MKPPLPVHLVHSTLDDAGLSLAAFRVHGHLARRTKNGRAWPSVKTMGETCGLERKTIFRALNELEAKGWVRREQQPGTSNSYFMTNPSTPPFHETGQAEKEPVPKLVMPPVTNSVTPPVTNSVTTPITKNGTQRGGIREGGPVKDIQGRGGRLPPLLWCDLSEADRQQTIAMTTKETAEETYGMWHRRKTKFKDTFESAKDAFGDFLLGVELNRERAAKATEAKLTKIMQLGDAEFTMTDLSELHEGAPRWRFTRTHRNGLPEYADNAY